MFNRNAFRTSLMFLGIIFFGIMARMFLVQDNLFVKSDSKNETANISCVFKGSC